MRGGRQKTGFTMIEMMAVVVIMAIAVGAATLEVHGVADQVRIRMAADQVQSIYRLALADATRSGLPRTLVFEKHGCAIRMPKLVEGQWRSVKSATFALANGVELTGIYDQENRPVTPSDDPPWTITASPSILDRTYVIGLACGKSVRGLLTLDGYVSSWKQTNAEEW